MQDALGQAGAGKVGNYEYSSFFYPVHARFRPVIGAHPTIGQIGQLEEVDEVMIECLCHKDILEEVITKLKAAPPYEEPAIDILPRYEIR